MKRLYSSRAELIINNAKQEMLRRKEAAGCTDQKIQCNTDPRKRLVYFQVRTIFVFCLHGLSDVGRGGALVETMTFNRRVVGSSRHVGTLGKITHDSQE